VIEESVTSEDQVGILDLLVIVFENAKLLILLPLAAGITALGISYLIPVSYTAVTRILPPQPQQSAMAILASQLGTLSALGGAAGLNLKNPADLHVALLRSRTVADGIIDRFDLTRLYEVDFREDARRALHATTSITSAKDGLITIEVEDQDAKRAADIANAYVAELFKLNGHLAISEAQQRRLFFEKELEKANNNLKTVQRALGKVGVTENLIKASPETVVGEVARLRAMVTAQEIRVSTMKSYLTEHSPELRLAQQELTSLRAQMVQAERGQPTHDAQTAEYLDKYRDFKYYEALFELMAKQYEVARMDEAREGAVVQVIDIAVAPERKSKPKRAQIAVITTLVTGFILLVMLLGRELLRSAQSDPQASTKIRRISAALRNLFRRVG
jgi:uncharacterized protein involved in exopolysaccharide biosynthesis